MREKINLFLLIGFLGLFSCQNNQTEKESLKTEILLVSTYHFVNQGLDVYNNEVDDYLTPKRQQEINDLVERLSEFKPTKILIEQNPNRQVKYDSLYTLFKEDKLDLNTLKNGQNEVYQLGFKIGKQSNVKRIYCVDADGMYLGRYVSMVADSLNLEDYIEHKKENEQSSKKHNEYILNHTILENFKKINTQKEIMRLHHTFNNHQIRIRDTENILESPLKQKVVEIDGIQYYMRSLDGENIGVENYVEWFKRNAKIYNNILNVTDKNDRIIVIFGTSHIRPLQLFFKDNPEYDIKETLKYLQ